MLLLSPYRSDECSGDEYVVEDECDHTDGASGAICSASCCKNATYVPVQVTDPGTLLKTKKNCRGRSGGSLILIDSRCTHGWYFVLQSVKHSDRTVGTVVKEDYLLKRKEEKFYTAYM